MEYFIVSCTVSIGRAGGGGGGGGGAFIINSIRFVWGKFHEPVLPSSEVLGW